MAKQKNPLTIGASDEASSAHNGADLLDSPAVLNSVDASEQVSGADEENPSGETPYDPPPIPRRVSAYAVALGQLERVSNFMHLEDDMRVYLRTCQRELIVHFPVQMDDGAIRMFTGFRVHHNMTTGPTKGGIRYQHDLTLDECRALAIRMTCTSALMNLPSCAAKRRVASVSWCGSITCATSSIRRFTPVSKAASWRRLAGCFAIKPRCMCIPAKPAMAA